MFFLWYLYIRVLPGNTHGSFITVSRSFVGHLGFRIKQWILSQTVCDSLTISHHSHFLAASATTADCLRSVEYRWFSFGFSNLRWLQRRNCDSRWRITTNENQPLTYNGILAMKQNNITSCFLRIPLLAYDNSLT